MRPTQNMKRKKWSELEELTLLNRYYDLLNSGALAKLKTREKKFKPIADHVNSVHHLQDPVNFPFKWTWRDVSIKVQNMRHQYLGVKQKIRVSNNEFNWDDGENHWENFLKYKEVFGDVELEVKSNSISNNNSTHGKRANSVHDGLEDAEYGEEGAAELFGEEDVMGLGFGFGTEDMEDEEEEEDDGDITYDFQFCPRDEFPVPDSNQKSSESSGDDSCSNNNDNNLEFQPENYSDGFPNEILAAEAVDMFINTNTESIVTEDTEYIELEPDAKNITNTDEEMLPQNHESDCSEKFEKSSLGRQFWESKNSVDDEDEDDDEFDILLEHKQLVQQMKMEMKNSKIKSLPTIVEEEEDDDECETTKMVEDLTPLKIEEKFEYKDLMGEIHKFYKSYAEKMRKLDILNYQSLHAINIVQLKDTRVFVLSKKASLPFIKHFGLPTFGTGKGRKVFADPSLKSITEVQRDLELVYIGQVCLSWEILRWQYGKLKLLLEYEYDSRGHHHSYNVVAGEYQQLQVLMHRFLEEELIQGPRIKHYVESRCLCRSILQVPIIKDDFSNKKDRLVVGEKDAIPITKLAETIKDSMQVFFEFIRSDKDGTIGSFKGTQLRNPADLELLSNIKTRLKKKERKLRDIQRSANCIVKKFQKHHHVETAAGGMSCGVGAVFISQVELKLVSRVLNLSRLTTDQLQWCLKKLNNINIVNRNVHVEPSFLLFPC